MNIFRRTLKQEKQKERIMLIQSCADNIKEELNSVITNYSLLLHTDNSDHTTQEEAKILVARLKFLTTILEQYMSHKTLGDKKRI